MKKKIPQPIRLHIKRFIRFCNDLLQGHYWSFAQKSDYKQHFVYKLSLSQPIKQTTGSINKVENLKIATHKMKDVVIYPNEIFSFWQIVGQPNQRNGYKKGRNLINGKLQEDYGGGLCQLSGIIYYLSLQASLKIEERHHHSFDIYTNETRYTPLGSDATVVYAYKDLRIRNNYRFPITFEFKVTSDSLQIDLLSLELIKKQTIEFEKQEHIDQIEVRTFNSQKTLIARSFYGV